MSRKRGKSAVESTKPTELEAEQVEAQAEAATAATREEELESLRAEVAELREKNLRVLADARNVQQRAQRDNQEALKYAEAEFARELLVVIDDLERVLESAKAAEGVDVVGDGVRIIYEHFLKVLKGRHIEPIAAEGEPFDPSFHEALMQQASEEHPAGTVIQELARGYKMHERVIRASRVVVSGGPAEAGQADGEAEKEP